MNILITGASGLVGTHLADYLLRRGHFVGYLVRKKTRETRVTHFLWDPAKDIIDLEAVQWADAIVHLAGASVSEGRWTKARKKEIVDSRVRAAELLAKTLRKEKKKPAVFVSASGVGIYGAVTNDHIYTETDPPGKDFLAGVCVRWEASADLVEEMDIRTVKLRIGVALAKEGGALPKLAAPVKWLAGSPLGNGRQWMPWIHIEDLCAMFLKAIDDEAMRGVYNAVAPQHATNKEVVKAIGKAMGKPVFLPPVPKFVLKMMLGEMAVIVTEGSRVSNEKIVKAGFEFKFPGLEKAVDDLLK